MGIKENYEKILSVAEGACVIAVTKYVNSQKIIEAYKAGIRNFGENKVQDAECKRTELPEEVNSNSIWHFLGHLQTNKVKKVVGNYDFIHSVDSLKLAKCISETAESKNIIQKVLLQVNVAREESKYGFSADTLIDSFKQLKSLKGLKLVGLMTMAPFVEEEYLLRKVFRSLRELRDKLNKTFGDELTELSMGMSNDYKIALEEGATMIRIGQSLFSRSI